MSRFLNDKLASLEPYTPGEQPKISRLIKLNTNENPYPPSPEVKRALAAMDKDAWRLYPDPQTGEAVEAIADHFGLTPAQVMLGNGSDEILAFAFMAYGQKVYFPEVSYGFYPVFAGLLGGEACQVPMPDLRIDPADYQHNDGMVVLANPNAPTGVELSPEAIESILRANPDQVVLVDEAYVDFGARSSLALLPKYDNLLVVQTFSKSRSLAGMRIGMAMGSEALIEDLNRIKFSFNPYNLSRGAIVAAAAAIRDEAYFETQCGRIIKTRQRFVRAVEALGFPVMTSRANFVFVKTGTGYAERLRARGILVRHWDKEQIRDWIRVTIGTDEDMEQLTAALKEIKQEENDEAGIH